jgi:hypothetical protein
VTRTFVWALLFLVCGYHVEWIRIRARRLEWLESDVCNAVDSGM